MTIAAGWGGDYERGYNQCLRDHSPETQRRETARLRKIIDDLPHADYCDTILADPGDGKCDCWKAEAGL